jgi:hypothetical protein
MGQGNAGWYVRQQANLAATSWLASLIMAFLSQRGGET